MGFSRDDLPVIPNLQLDLNSLLVRDLFSLAIQPILDLRTGDAFTGEALARLDHPEHGTIPAEVFTSLLDEAGLYHEFDLYIFRKCCLWLQRTKMEGKRFDRLFCNFSRRTLSRRGIAGDLIRIADSSGVPRRKLGIEITECRQSEDMKQMTENLKELKAAGFLIILDDYGSGVTCEKDLQSFPLDIVKLDQLLLQKAAGDGREAFRALAADLTRRGIEVVGEGIETEDQDTLAREAGCRYGQGYLYFTPVPQERVLELIPQARNQNYY